jgi:putative peptide maturation dehydrogenase
VTRSQGGTALHGRIRRSGYFDVRIGDDGSLIAISALAGLEVAISAEELKLLISVPETDWVELDSAWDGSCIRGLLESGLLLSEDGDGLLAEIRQRDAQLRAPPWNRHAAIFHAMTRWSDVRSTPSPARQTRDPARWPPPGHFHRVADRLARVGLPSPETDGAFFDLLASRRTTTRGFDPSAFVTGQQLSTILYWVWGCHGTLDIVPGELTLLRKTSPSAGAQHPTEVYPLVRKVEGVPPGLYHYDLEHHSLELLDELVGRDLLELNLELIADQEHFASASVVFYMTSRFGRNFWKYPLHMKAYKVLLFDAGHLSQTMYLTCAHLGLGSFVTGAFNEVNVDRILRLAAFKEGSILVAGCGHPANVEAEPRYSPFHPRHA